ncbi:MAG: aminotransferase class III-fold pyridoxal phosphate-dependent enzyme [Bacteroidetes bacterium]|nr:MAG: aminotransferase class III-fold pyridoxal phosphate-dependent enzyme [Bacteroidota bacterium]
MKLFNVYPLFDITPVKAKGCYVWDSEENCYLDLYGGHAVISIGHSHPHYVQRLHEQLNQLAFYSNSVRNPLQEELAEKLGELSGYPDYHLFLCNSGAEAIENALKLASFYNGRSKVVCFERGFHGRTSGAVAITDNARIQAPINFTQHVVRLPWEEEEQLRQHLQSGEICAVVLEGIQGIGGVYEASPAYWQLLRQLCDETDTVLIADEIQSGYGRTGQFFAHQHAGVQPDLITLAKGMGNGFPIGGVMIGPRFEASYGLLGTTFGGNHLACTAGIAVLEVLERENLMHYATETGNYLMDKLRNTNGVREVRGKGLMIGVEMEFPIKELRAHLLSEHYMLTGSSSQPHTLRLLPPLCLTHVQADDFISAFGKAVAHFREKTVD